MTALRGLRSLLLIGWILAPWRSGLAQPAQESEAVPSTRLERLTRGINLSHWMAQSSLTPDHVRTYFTEADAALIKSMGFRHVRLTLDPKPLWNEVDPAALEPGRVAMLDDGLDLLSRAGLAVIVDLHPQDDFKRRLAREPAFPEKFAQFWGALAAHLSRRDPEGLFLEVLNEPHFVKGEAWDAIQSRALAAMRASAPRHTLIADAGEWSTVAHLLALKPVADRNVVYNFHFYEPAHFTHQGANWGYASWKHMHDVPYPLDAKTLEPVLGAIDNDRARNDLKWVARSAWDRKALREQFGKAAAWAKAQGVPLTCNEFGVYAKVAPRGARLAWLGDVREEMEAAGIGWCMWDYAGGFRVVQRGRETRTPDEELLAVLGLKSKK